MSLDKFLAALRIFVVKFDGLKKISAALAGLIVAAFLRLGIQLDAASVAAVLSPILAYLIGQGIADSQKIIFPTREPPPNATPDEFTLN